MIFLPIIIFIFGLIIGSFLNVVILRINTGRSIVKGHSKCANCSNKLKWYELIPVFSFLFLKGKCRSCKNQISFQYALVELATALTFTISYIRIVLNSGFSDKSWLVFVFSMIISSFLIVILIYDLRHKIIPDNVVYPFIVFALISIFWKFFILQNFNLFGALFDGVLVALPFFLLWFLSKGKLMGFGDVKLTLGIGWLLGLSGGFAALFISFWFGGIIGLFLIALSREYKMKSEVPFGPFLILGVFIVGLWGLTINSLLPIW